MEKLKSDLRCFLGLCNKYNFEQINQLVNDINDNNTYNDTVNTYGIHENEFKSMKNLNNMFGGGQFQQIYNQYSNFKNGIVSSEKMSTQKLAQLPQLPLLPQIGGQEDAGEGNEIVVSVKPDSEEVGDYKWMSIEDLEKDLKENPDAYTVWFKVILRKVLDQALTKNFLTA